MKPTINFINWYKICCDSDNGVYRRTKYSFKKACVFYKSVVDKDYVIYELDANQKLISGTKEFCETYIQKNLNTKFLIFNLKKDKAEEYFIKNELVNII